MDRLGSVLALALAEAAASLADRAATDGQARLAERLLALMTLSEPPLAAAFTRAVTRASAGLQSEGGPAVEAVLTLLAADYAAAASLRRVAIEELLLCAPPDLAHLAEVYRRELRPALTATGLALPPWHQASLALVRLLAELLPQTLAEQARLRQLVLTPDERAELAQLRAGWSVPVTPFVEQLGQRVIAVGGTISHVQQTIVHGDFYTTPLPHPPDLALLYAHYRAWIAESFATLDFRGLLQNQAPTRLSLEEIYTPVTAVPLDADQPVIPLHQFVCAQPLLVVLGDPGSGKSTLVRYVLLSLIRGDAHARLGLEPNWLPIFFPVAAFAAARARPGQGDLAPLAYLGEYYRGLSQPDYGPLFVRALETGRALVLLDGLDEVRGGRQAIVRALEAFARHWDALGNRFIATSRIVGYDEAPLDPALFAAVVIQPLAETQIRQFIMHWCSAALGGTNLVVAPQSDLLHELVAEAAAHERERRIAARTAALTEAVFAESHVAELARNPLLLTILALIHNQGARLPDRRAELYRLCVAALAETWNRARSLSGRPVDVHLGDELLDERFVVNLLGPVALALYAEQPGSLIEQDDLEARLAATFEQADGLPRRKARRLAGDFVELMRRETGLLQERGYRRFAFLHLTFEEYLAARGLLESVAITDPDGLLRQYAADPRWREVVRLAVASAPQREAGRLLQAMIAAPADGPERGHPVLLAGECLRDVGRNGAGGRAWDAVITALLALLADPEVPVATRRAGALVLGQLDDPRRLDPASGRAVGTGTAHVPDYWCDLVAGPCWYGDEAAARGRTPALVRLNLPHSLRIARYPVTNAEYSQFIAAGGYLDSRWWTPAGLAFLAPGGARRNPDEGDGPILAPALWQQPHLRAPNQPVVGVSWYEAVAYCAWLSSVGHAAGWLYPGERLRLPTAFERERAARHTDRRRYPWGEAPPDPERACYAASGLRAPAPVGIYPAGAAHCGALDLAGNVWEWTATPADQLADPHPHHDLPLDCSPAIKGGAFNWDAEALRCGAHYWFHPAQRYNLLGFRLVWAAEPAPKERQR
ncbi:MAG: NACHT domain-containing protein [Oscillochloridaceae bacterium umkhey_bin13]